MNEPSQELWQIDYSTAALRQKRKLPKQIQFQMDVLAKELELNGPIRKNWPHFSLLKKDKHIPEGSFHCHIKSGRPTYVACWQVENKNIKFIEIFYVGTHENAPY
jgi:mRNA-degrading endonuclease RelE of RelBE toxin-antitoxin system